jgi:hypothetical protein
MTRESAAHPPFLFIAIPIIMIAILMFASKTAGF